MSVTYVSLVASFAVLYLGTLVLTEVAGKRSNQNILDGRRGARALLQSDSASSCALLLCPLGNETCEMYDGVHGTGNTCAEVSELAEAELTSNQAYAWRTQSTTCGKVADTQACSTLMCSNLTRSYYCTSLCIAKHAYCQGMTYCEADVFCHTNETMLQSYSPDENGECYGSYDLTDLIQNSNCFSPPPLPRPPPWWESFPPNTPLDAPPSSPPYEFNLDGTITVDSAEAELHLVDTIQEFRNSDLLVILKMDVEFDSTSRYIYGYLEITGECDEILNRYCTVNLNGNQGFRLLGRSKLVLKHLTVENGYGRGGGGVVEVNLLAIFEARFCDFNDNVARGKGGVAFIEGSATFESCTFSGNNAQGNDADDIYLSASGNLALVRQEDDIQLGTTLGQNVVNVDTGNASDGSSSSSGPSSQITIEEFKPPPPPPSPPVPPPPIPLSPEPPAVPGKPGRPVLRYPPTIFETGNQGDEEYNYLATWIGVGAAIFAVIGCLSLTKLYMSRGESKATSTLTPFPEVQKPGGGFLSRLDSFVGTGRLPSFQDRSPSTKETEYLSAGKVAVNGQVATVNVPKTTFYQKRLERSQTNVVALHIQKVKAKQNQVRSAAMPKPGFAKPMIMNHEQPPSSPPRTTSSGPQEDGSTMEETGLVVPKVMPEKISRTSIAGSPYFKSNLKHQNRLLN